MKETLLSKGEKDEMEVRLLQGKDFEQVKVSQGLNFKPDPRVAGP